MQPIKESAIKLSKQVYNTYAVQLPYGTSLEDALKPEFWVHFSHKLRIGDQLELLPVDMSFYARLLVRNASLRFADVGLIQHVEFEDAAEPPAADDEYTISWSGISTKFRIIRRSDNVVMAENLKTKEAAHQALAALKPKAA
jgi:hypothetical protein